MIRYFSKKQFGMAVWGFLLPALLSAQITAMAQTANYPVTLRLQPDFLSFFDHNYLFVDLRLNTGGELINAIDTTIRFATTSLKLASSTLEQSFCSFVIFNEINNQDGYYRLSCGTPIAASSTDQFIARLKFKKLQPGFTKLEVAPESSVLAHDGLGTNILRDREIHNIYLFK